MTTIPEPAPRKKWKRWVWIGLSVVLLATAAGVWMWWFVVKPQSDARAPFVGTWRRESPKDLKVPARVHEMHLQDDGTKHVRVWDSQTGAIVLDVPGQLRWRVVHGRLQQGHYGNPLLNHIGIGPWNAVFHDGAVTWEGADRFRYQDDKSGGRSEVWVRIDHLGDK